MTESMTEIHRVVSGVCDAPLREIERVADLSLIATIAYDLDLFGKQRWDGSALMESIVKISQYSLPNLSSSRAKWSLVAAACSEGSERAREGARLDRWITDFLAADPGRKTRGAYATPPAFAFGLAKATLAPLADTLSRPARIFDPSAGTGALLIGALRFLGKNCSGQQLRDVVYALHGVEIDARSRELCCLFLWLAAAHAKADLSKIAQNIVVDNAITRTWSQRDCQYDALLMNPPWESLRHTVSERDPQSDSRQLTIARLSQRQTLAGDLPPLFSLQGSGDRNLFKAFVELAPHLLPHGGRLGALIPAAFASDLGMAKLRDFYFWNLKIDRWTSFENLRRHFQIDGRYKFGVLVGTRTPSGTSSIAVRCFATEPQELDSAHVLMDRKTISILGGSSRMIPELQDEDEERTLVRIINRGTPFFANGSLGLVRYRREVDLTLDKKAGLFSRFEEHNDLIPTADGFETRSGEKVVPLIEGRMVGQYDFFQKSWVSGNGRTAKWNLNGERSLSACIPQFVMEPNAPQRNRVAICDVTSATNTRTVHATLVPDTWRCGNTAPVLIFAGTREALAGLAVLNSMIFDWVARRLVGGLHLNKFYLAAMVWPALNDTAVSELSKSAALLTSVSPRKHVDFEKILGRPSDISAAAQAPDASVSARIEIERQISAAFELEPYMIERIFTDHRSDRRGFWRYYAENPHTRSIGRALVRDLIKLGQDRKIAPSIAWYEC